MNEKSYKKRLDFQQKMIARQSKQIEDLKSQVESLKLECEEKDGIIHSVDFLKKELTENIEKHKKYTKEYSELIQELKNMKKIVDKELYKGRWKLVRFLIK